jgi:hypothetical protein
MESRPNAKMTDAEICQKAAELTNKSVDDVMIKQIKKVSYLCIKREMTQTVPDVYLRYFQFVNIEVVDTLIGEKGVVTPCFRMKLEGDFGARQLLELISKEKMLVEQHKGYLRQHEFLLQILSQGVPGKFEIIPRGAKINLTKAEANAQFKTIFANAGINKLIQFEQDHFVLPYFAYATMSSVDLTVALAELLVNSNAANDNQDNKKTLFVVVNHQCDHDKADEKQGSPRSPGL